MARDDYLFAKNDSDSVFRAQEARMLSEIDSAPEEHVLEVDPDAWIEALVERYRVDVPVLHANEKYMDRPQETEIVVSASLYGYAVEPGRDFKVPGTRNIVHIPFTGDGDVFAIQPMSFTTTRPIARVKGNEVIGTWESRSDSLVDLATEVNDLIGGVEKYLAWWRDEATEFNAQLDQLARQSIQQRQERIRRNYDTAAASGIPIASGPRDSGKTYMTDAITRKPSPSMPTRLETPMPLEPELAESMYEHILGVLRDACLQMERSPRSYLTLDEEARRDVLLTTLNSHYRGKAIAEAFNHEGKTDILVRVEDANVFICECKFWEGPKSYSDAIDQLFRYRAWRDTKLALVIFVRELGLTDIIAKGKAALEAHVQFIESQTPVTETELAARVSWPGDPERLARLTTLFVHTPE